MIPGLPGQRSAIKSWIVSALNLSLFAAIIACTPSSQSPTAAEEFADSHGWISLFDGESLAGWEITDFGGQGKVTVRDGEILLPMGQALTGITWQGEFPREGYEISAEARRLVGNDFFCALTFPVGEEHCSLIVGGWGGTTVGLSSIDGWDASENETTQYMSFQPEQWYKIRVRVIEERISCWIDDEQVVEVPRADRSFSVRAEVRLSRPLGIAAWQTTAAVRDLRYRMLEESAP